MRVLPVDDADELDPLAAALVLHGDLDAIAQEIPDVVVGMEGMVGGTIFGELGDGLVYCSGWEGGIEFGERGAEAVGQDDIVPGFTTERVIGSAEFVVAGLGLPSEGGEELNGWLLDQLVLGVVGHRCPQR